MPTLEYKIVKDGDVLDNILSDFVLLIRDGFGPIENSLDNAQPFLLDTIAAYLPNEIRGDGSYYYLKINEIGNSMILRKDMVVNRPIHFSPQFLQPIMSSSPISNIPIALVKQS